ncbi:MAG: HAMP domain-containing histidine kinase [Actinomycetota bacterium]|nr:HAMP domain-containing histidine kinase [Actinomycetota bacterium]
MLDRLPIRWRLALTSAGLTLVILSGFAVVVGQLTVSRIRSDYNNELAAAVDRLRDGLGLSLNSRLRVVDVRPNLDLFGASSNAVIRVLDHDGTVLAKTRHAPNLGFPLPARGARVSGYRVETRDVALRPRSAPSIGLEVSIQYARKVSDLENTVARVRVFLAFGVFGGTLLALLGGVVLGRRAMLPVAALTAAARDIERTRDPGKTMPQLQADDEVAELARTLQAMLDGLEASRDETEAMLTRQREFVADASHELRTPLTSILANLELLAEVLDGERGETARSALRSSRRMRRLVGDLLLLARADANRQQPHEPTDLGRVLVDVAAELGPVAEDHDLSIDPAPAVVDGARDELHRMALNLMENALRHTPPGSRVHARTDVREGEVVLVVEDDGPGVAPELRERAFERFVRGAGDRGSSSGLGLAIVRAVAESHGGRVTLEDARPGARFVVHMPQADAKGAVEPAVAIR